MHHLGVEAPLCGVCAIPRQEVGQLVVGPLLVDRTELDQSGDQSLIQSVGLIECLCDHSCLLVDIRHGDHVVGFDQDCLAGEFLFQMKEG